MKIKCIWFLLLSFISHSTYSQQDKEVLFTINDKPFYTDEFKRIYTKNLDLVKDESQKDLENYLNLFVGYKLKVVKANKLGLQNNISYINELKSYRTQLAKDYLTDSKVTQELIDEAFLRMQSEVKASHILINVAENASPEDTLAAYNKIVSLRKKIFNGEDFNTMAHSFSEDPSAKENKGNLGYFSAFRMVYPFETAAFTTKKGNVSKPIRTRFGYHLIFVHDSRANRGEITVAHIMLLNPETNDVVAKEKAKNTIQEIYTKLQQGEKFEDLAKQFSDDKSSAAKGGLLNKFGSGQISSEAFEDTAFLLSKENPISKPVETQFGWHILKFVEKHASPTLEESKPDLESKISKDERSRRITASLLDKIKTKYPVKINKAELVKVNKAVNNLFYDMKWELPTNTKELEGDLVVFASEKLKTITFLEHLKEQQKSPSQIKPIAKVIEYHLNTYIDQKLQDFYDVNLENEFSEFAAVMEEYRDGLLLFDLMEKEIWDRSKKDSVGLEEFFLKNSSKYQWKNRYDVQIVSATKEEILKNAVKLIKKEASAEMLKTTFNKDKAVEIMVQEGVFEEEHSALPKTILLVKGISKIVKEGDYYYIVKVKEIKPAGAKLLKEIKARVINDYQQFLEKNWVAQLKNEFEIKVNQAVFERVKRQLNK